MSVACTRRVRRAVWPTSGMREASRKARRRAGLSFRRPPWMLSGRAERRALARTPLARWVAQTVQDLAESSSGGIPLEAVLERRAERRSTRREFLRGAGALGVVVAGGGVLGRLAPTARGAAGPRIVVVGAGLAGLTCAYRLRQAGYSAAVYEASDRVGGRCWTIRGVFADGQLG